MSTDARLNSLLSAQALSTNVRALKPSATLEINERSAKLMKEGKQIYRLGLGQSPFPVPTHMVNALKQYAQEKDYLPVKGLLELREAVVARLNSKEGLNWEADHVIIGPGSKELIFMVQMAFDAHLILPSPSWVSYAPQAQLSSRQVTWLETTQEQDYKLSVEQLESLCASDPTQRRLIILNSPCNPTGACYTEDELQALSTVFRKYQILVISDEIYSDTHFTQGHVSIARYYPEGTIVSDGISKWAGAGGWRLGFMCFPKQLSWLVNGMASMASETFTSVSAPIQYAAISGLIECEEMRSYLNNCRKLLLGLATYADHILSTAGVSLSAAQGGFYIFPSFDSFKERLAQRGISNGSELAQRLLEDCGVATLSGVHFGRDDAELTLRLALVDFDGQKVLEALENESIDFKIDETFMTKYCERVIIALNKMTEWIKLS